MNNADFLILSLTCFNVRIEGSLMILVLKCKIFKVYLKCTCNSSTLAQSIYFSISLVGLQHYFRTIKVH